MQIVTSTAIFFDSVNHVVGKYFSRSIQGIKSGVK